MKRQSKAEEALTKQVKWLEGQEDRISKDIATLLAQKEGLRFSRSAIEAEISQLTRARERASAKAKSGP